MKRLTLTALILKTASPSISFREPLQILVVSCDDKTLHVSFNVHNRCKGNLNFWKCINRAEGQVILLLQWINKFIAY
mgnify:CR=1 FL=1